MDSLYVNIINEGEKIYRRRKNLFFIGALVIFSLAVGVTSGSIESRLGIVALSGNNFPLVFLSMIVNLVLPLIVMLVAADMTAGERGEGTVGLALTRPTTRLKVYLAKNIALASYIFVTMMVVMHASWQIGTLTGQNVSGLASFGQVWWTYVVAAIPAIVLGVVAVSLFQLFKSSGTAIGVGLLLFMGARGLGVVYPEAKKLVLVSNMDWHSLWLAAGGTTIQMMGIAMLFMAYALIFFGIGYYLFDRTTF